MKKNYYLASKNIEKIVLEFKLLNKLENST